MSGLFDRLDMGMQLPMIRQLRPLTHGERVTQTQGVASPELQPTPGLTADAPAGRNVIAARELSLEQLRDAILERQIRQELSSKGTWEMRAQILDQLEHLFNRSVDADALRTIENSIKNQLAEHIEIINRLGREIAALNGQITSGRLSEQQLSNARERQGRLTDDLSEFVEISVQGMPAGLCHVYLGASEFVQGPVCRELAVKAQTGAAVPAQEIVWKHAAEPVKFSNGRVGALLQARDKWLPDVHEALASIQLPSTDADNSQQSVVVDRPAMPTGRAAQIDFYASVVAAVAARSSEARHAVEVQTMLVEQLTNQRQSWMKGEIEGQLAEMMRHQHANEAATRVIMAMDEAIATVLNGLGIVES